ncbi:efflux RND transporter periplasmic adaptor subunit [Chitinophaga sp. XS-30]|uniref:efflux RND transporter periplasmic adaptor subunit n=1 Tax=Chitinophaga sp. XS-30 TaxID=2604421 RepID=UPI0011DDBA18|nr:efflux RND transporter periplasmic adaptor subunit [Chitinophaga sp. XS-30]QEH39648.1 efflux RND transporter periplasmic adaptor subunit [Chitinophaga sp. XS-30]
MIRTNNNIPVLFAAILLAGCGVSQSKPDNRPAEETVAANAVSTFALKKDVLSATLRMPGELIAFQQVDLYAKVNSFVKKLYVDVGSTVKAGQLLATMEAPELNAQLAGAESRLHSQEAVYLASKANYDRLYQTSQTPGTVSRNDLDLAYAKQQSDFAQQESAKAAYREIADTRNYLEIRAPFEGVISSRNVSAGAYVGPSGKGSEFPLFSLQQQKKLRLVVSIPEAYTAYLAEKKAVSFTIRSMGGKEFTAVIDRLSGALDSRLRSQRVEMDVDNSNKALLPGMVAEVSIPLNNRDSVFVVPSTAVVSSTEKVFVVRVNNGAAEWVEVRKGREAEGKAEIFGDLYAGDILVEKANDEIRNGSKIAQKK